MTRTRSAALTSVAALIVAVVALCSCGTSSTSGATRVHPFEDIRASAITFEPDLSDPTRAIAHVTTRVPTICAIVWGPDPRFGRFNNSLVMNGTGITQHDVALPNVAPGVTYSYVIEALTSDGTMFRSATTTFQIGSTGAVPTTLPADLPGADITSKATVARASSEYSGAFSAANAIDGNPTTEWATNGDGDAGSITLDLGAALDIKGIEFVTRSMADGTATTSTYTVSIDGGPPLGPFDAATPTHAHPVAVTGHGRLIRIDVVKSSGGNVGAIDIHVYG